MSLNPTVHLEHLSTPKGHSMHLTSHNGKLCWIIIKDTNGNHIALNDEKWKDVVTTVNRLFLTHHKAHIGDQQNIPDLSASDIQSIQLPLDLPNHLLSYTDAQGKKTELTETASSHTKDMLKELQDIFHGSTTTKHQFVSTHSEQFLEEYTTAYPHIRTLYTSLDQDMPEDAFLFYLKHLFKNQSDHKIYSIDNFDVTNIQKKDYLQFFAIRWKYAKQKSLLGVILDPINKKITITTSTHLSMENLEKDPTTQKMLTALQTEFKDYSLSIEPTLSSQPHRTLTLFLNRQLDPSHVKPLDPLYQIAQTVHSCYLKEYEQHSCNFSV